MTIQVKQNATFKGNDWWEWSVWLEGSKKDLDGIDHVVYTLHPTFPNPVVQVDDRKSGFRLNSAGWGEFEIYIEVKLKDGKTHKRKHWLTLRGPAKVTRKVGLRGARVPYRKEVHPQPTVFISGGIRDIEAVTAVREAFSRHGATVVGTEETTVGMPWQRSINDLITRADVAVFVISGRPNLWLNEEINTALRRGVRHIVPLLVGPEVQVPESLRNQKAIRIEDSEAVGAVVDKIVGSSLA